MKIVDNPGLFLTQGSEGRAAEQAATVLHTSATYVKDAKNLKTNAPDLFEQVLVGEINLPEAKKESRKV